MSFSEEYKQGLRGDGGHGVDIFSYSYQMGAQDREKAAQSGGAGGGGGGGGGAFLGIFAAIIAFCAFVIALISYPIASMLTGAAFAIGVSQLTGEGQSQMNGLGLLFVLMVPCYIIFVFSFKIEQKVAHSRAYRVFRQYWRIVVGTFIVYALGTGLLRGGDAGLFEYLILFVMTVSAPVLTYLNSMRLDKKYKHDPINFAWLDLIIDPIKNRLVPKVSSDLRETGVMRAKSRAAGTEFDVQVSNGTVTLGTVSVPVASIREIDYEREARGPLFAAGVVIPVILIVIIGKMSGGDFRGFFPQLFGLASLVIGAILIFFAAVQATPPGKLAGPFRSLVVLYSDPSSKTGLGVVFLHFEKSMDERMFIQALENGLKAMPRIDLKAAASGTAQEAPASSS